MKAWIGVAVVVSMGWALEVAHPVLLDGEPLVVWTQTEDPPTLSFCGRPWPAAWRKTQEGERIRWETSLRGAPLGVWIVQSGPDSAAFLRVDANKSVLELVGGPPRAVVWLDGRAYPLGETGASFFLLEPGRHTLAVEHLCDRWENDVHLLAGQRTRVELGHLGDLRTSSDQVLPGHRITLSLELRSALSLPFVELQLGLPPGWQAMIPEDGLSPVPRDRWIQQDFLVEVPPGVEEGRYTIEVRWHGWVRRVTVAVVKSLSPLVVVGHWDVGRGELDLRQPFALTYERALWAASLLGKPIPYSMAIMTPELLQAILEHWASGEGG